MRFKVIERRSYDATYIIDADDERAARRLEGEIVSEDHSDCWGDEVLSVEMVEGEDE